MINKEISSEHLGSIIDLGCGTGLFGEQIKALCENLEGVDLSGKMLVEAKKKNLYNKLIKQDIETFLLTYPLSFDYFVATDVFVYIGDLTEIFRSIKARNALRGKLLFSTEDCDGSSFSLERSGRYSHSKGYIECLARRFGYNLRCFEKHTLRRDGNNHILGGLYMLDF